jgi:lipoprotein-releasing system ATP-binding protein
VWLPQVFGASLAVDILLLGGSLLVAFSPLLALAALGPRRRDPVETKADEPLIRATNLQKTYNLGGRRLRVLRGVSLSVRRGEFVAILGTSGSGKSTLLHLLGLLDTADGGSVVLDGTDSTALPSSERDRIRCHDIGFVFQFYHLLPELNVLENTLLPAMTASGVCCRPGKRRRMRQRAMEILAKVGLSDRLKHRPGQLSGGEQQRVAIARAFMNSPKILLADEPTGNLDSKTGAEIIKVLKQLNQEAEQTIVMVTHDQALAEIAGRVLHLRDGRLH